MSMINRDDIEAGDKVYTRDGGCLVAYERNCGVHMAGHLTSSWRKTGYWLSEYENHPLDIIRIEKAPKPVVKEIWLCSLNGVEWSMQMHPETVSPHPHIIKLTIINGKLDKAEQVK